MAGRGATLCSSLCSRARAFCSTTMRRRSSCVTRPMAARGARAHARASACPCGARACADRAGGSSAAAAPLRRARRALRACGRWRRAAGRLWAAPRRFPHRTASYSHAVAARRVPWRAVSAGLRRSGRVTPVTVAVNGTQTSTNRLRGVRSARGGGPVQSTSRRAPRPHRRRPMRVATHARHGCDPAGRHFAAAFVSLAALGDQLQFVCWRRAPRRQRTGGTRC